MEVHWEPQLITTVGPPSGGIASQAGAPSRARRRPGRARRSSARAEPASRVTSRRIRVRRMVLERGAGVGMGCSVGVDGAQSGGGRERAVKGL